MSPACTRCGSTTNRRLVGWCEPCYASVFPRDEDPVAIRRLHERDAFRDQVDAIRTALGCRVGEALGTDDIVALLRAAGVTGSMVDAVEEIRNTWRARAAAELSVLLWLAARRTTGACGRCMCRIPEVALEWCVACFGHVRCDARCLAAADKPSGLNGGGA